MEEKQHLPTASHLARIQDNAETYLVSTVEKSGAVVSKESKAIIRRFLDQTSRGFVGTMSMSCHGQHCPFISACPLKEAGLALPVGKKCPVEQSIVHIWVNKHLDNLGIKDINAPENSFDMDMLYELAGQELIRWRCGVHLSDTPALISRELVGSTLQGDELFADVINPVLEIMERAGKNISKLREALVATRKSQVEAGKDLADHSQRAAAQRAKALDILRDRERQIETVKEADFEVKPSAT